MNKIYMSRAMILALVGCCSYLAPAFGIELGQPAGAVRLIDTSGAEFVMQNYDERPATAVFFLSSRCQFTEKAIADINTLYQKYRLRNVLYVGVCSNKVETADELREFSQKRGMIFSIHRDPSGSVGKHFGARATPEVFLLDRKGNLIFRGGLDSSQGRDRLETAVRSVLAGKPAEVAGVAVRGTPINNPGPKISRDDPYGHLSFSSELIFEKIPRAVAYHCSTIAEAPNGDLLCLWYGGSYESADDQVLFLARRKSGKRHWSEPEVLIEDFRQPPGNGVIFVDGKDRVWVVWCRMESTRPIRRGAGWNHCRLFYRISSDNGQTWSKDYPMLAEDELVQNESLWFVPRNPAIVMKNGTTVLALEAVLNGVDGSIFLTSNNHGENWQRGGFTTGGSQPAVAERSDGSLLAFMRKRPRITQIISNNSGKTWSDATETVLRNPNAGISMTRLQNGHFVLVFNDSSRGRTPLSIVRSLDEGKTWETPLKLESNPGEYSYPCIIQSADGKIHVTYTFRRYAIKHVELNEDWLVEMRRPN